MKKIIKKINFSFFQIVSGGRVATPGAPRDTWNPMGPHINYREERANARDEREVFISGRHYRRQDDEDGIITRPKSYSWVKSNQTEPKPNSTEPEFNRT